MLPKSIISRPKTPYRAPIQQSLCAAKIPEYIQEALSEKVIKSSGYFDTKKTALLLKKIQFQKNISEVDNMALAGILSTQLTHSRFVKTVPISPAFLLKPGLLIDHRSGNSECSAMRI